MLDQKHLVSIDIIRLISAFAIITIHVSSFVAFFLYLQVPQPQWLVALFLNSFFRWGTPMFIMISGYLILNSSTTASPKVFYHRRLQKLLIPFVFWNIFYYFIYSALNLDHPTLVDFINRLSGGGPFYHLYFLPLIIGLYLITPLITRNFQRLKLPLLVPSLMILSYIYMLLCYFFNFPQLNNFLTWFILYIGYYLAGYWLPRTKFHPNLLFVLITFSFPVIGFLGDKYFVNLFGVGDRGEFLTHRLSYLIAIPALTLFQYLIHLKINFSKNFLSKIYNLSSLSFGVYLIHPAIIQIFVTFHPFTDHLKNYPILWTFSVIPVTILFSFLLVRVLKSVPILSRTI
jgi:surface polysaccharide O-acyltransferase-like enzyme